MKRRPPFPLVLALFFLSGATGLLYQVVWVRLFSFLFGATVPAVSTVLAAFMGGLALGGWWGGRRADGWASPLRVYGLLEAALAVLAAAVPLLLRAADPLYSALYEPLQSAPGALTAVRFAVSTAILLPPTFLMGATLPALTRFATSGGDSRARIARLYAVNTFGAVAGTILATFVLLPSVGLRSTLATGIAMNALVAIGAIALARRGAEAGQPPASAARAGREPRGRGGAPGDALPFPRPLLYVAAGVLGFSALALEVLWTRALALALGTTTYAFATVLAVFLLGIAGGSALAARRIRSGRGVAAVFAACPAVIGLLAIALLPVFDRLPDLFVALSARGEGTWTESVLVEFVLAGIPLLLPTLVSGAAFPLAVAAERRSSGPRAVGDLYAANTLGAIVGSWAAGFVLLRALGLQGGIQLAASLQIAMTATLLLAWRGDARARARGVAVALAAVGAVAWAAMPAWDRAAMTRGGFVLGSDLRRAEPETLAEAEDGELVFVREGATSTVTVRRENGEYTMQLNGVTEASTGGDLSTQVSVAALPLVLHGAVRDALVIGLGGGITAGTVARFPGVESIDCVEISAEVAAAAAAHFSGANGGVLDDPRFRLIVGDGRNHVALTRRDYDAIVSLPSHVWNAGIGSLMSEEFYGLCRARLRPGGVLCSWIQGYALSPDALRSVLAAVRSAFPRVQLWRGTWGDLLIVAGDDGLAIDVGRIRELGSDPAVAAVLYDADAPDLASLLSLNLLAGDALDRWVGGFAANTDDRPYLEFAAPKLLYADPMPELFGALHAAAAGTEQALAGEPEGVRERLAAWRRGRAAESEARLALRDGRGDAALRGLEEAYALLPMAPSIRRTLAGTLNMRGAALARRGQTTGAAESFARGIDVDPGLPASYSNLARMYLDGGDADTALELIDEGLRASPRSAELHALRAQALYRARRLAEARDAAGRALELSPRLLAGFEALAAALEGLGETARAESVLTEALAAHPDAGHLRSRLERMR